jgi:mono/diheme cytochrome c family protein
LPKPPSTRSTPGTRPPPRPPPTAWPAAPKWKSTSTPRRKPPPTSPPPTSSAYLAGHAIYFRDGHCGTCHQADGNGLPSAGFPPLTESPWVSGSEERLIKLTLHGLMGPFELKGVKYPGQVPMTPFGGLLNDQEIADVLTYVRNSFGNKAAPVTPESVAKVRKAVGTRSFYSPEELLKEHPDK